MASRNTYTPGLIQDETESSYVRVYDARLVPHVGILNAMVFGQIVYWLKVSGGKQYDDHHWIYKSGRELADELGLSKDQTKRALKHLCSIGLLVAIRNPYNGQDKTLWYRINEDHELFHGADLHSQGAESHSQSVGAHRGRGKSAPSRRTSQLSRRKSAPTVPESTSEDDEQENTPPTHPHKSSENHARDDLGRESEDEGSARRSPRTKPARRKARRGIPESELATQEPSGNGKASQKPDQPSRDSENPLAIFRTKKHLVGRLHDSVRQEEERGTPQERVWTVSGKYNNPLGTWTATPKDFLAMVEAAS